MRWLSDADQVRPGKQYNVARELRRRIKVCLKEQHQGWRARTGLHWTLPVGDKK